MTQFIFGIVPADDFAISAGVKCFVDVSTKDYFDQEGYQQDGYDEHDYDELIAVMDKYNMVESTESSFECVDYTAEEITAKLNAEPNFNFSQTFHDFLNK